MTNQYAQCCAACGFQSCGRLQSLLGRVWHRRDRNSKLQLQLWLPHIITKTHLLIGQSNMVHELAGTAPTPDRCCCCCCCCPCCCCCCSNRLPVGLTSEDEGCTCCCWGSCSNVTLCSSRNLSGASAGSCKSPGTKPKLSAYRSVRGAAIC